MTGTPRGRQNQYQPRLPGTAEAGTRAPRPGPRTAAGGRGPATTTGRPRTTERREHPAPAPAPPRSASAGNQSWRLDEKTRRAGRQGVAAARAALARVAQTGNDRQADAA